MKAQARTIGKYLDEVPADKRAALGKLRREILAAAPGAEECISYGVPSFRFDGKLLVGFGVTAHYCSFYPMSSYLVASLKKELAAYDIRKGTIHFHQERPLPAALVRKIVKARIEENAGPAAKKAGGAARGE